MTKTLTLDEILADIYEHTGDKGLDPEWVDVVQHNNKQAILQWVATEVVGRPLPIEIGGKERREDRAELRDEQRQILRAAGWKPSDKEVA